MQIMAANGKTSAEKFEGMRRLSIPDLNEHGAWLLARLLKVHPHLDERTLAGYVRSLVENNETLFLYQPNSIALAQVERGYTLDPRPIVRVRYVIARDDTHINEAAGFYEHIRQWAKHMDAEYIVLDDVSDVPLETIKKKLGKTFEKQIVYARV